MNQPEILLHRDAEQLTAAAAARLIVRLHDAQAARASASVALTGGRAGIAMLAQLRATPAAAALDWSAIDVYWGDERYLPHGDPERNDTQARDAFLDHVDIPAERVHAMPCSNGEFGEDVDAAARHYAAHIEGVRLDVCLLGVGEEGHTASLFPHTPAVSESERTVVAVHDCPKPPPTRISLTLRAIRQAREVWLMTTGASKSEAVAAALDGAEPVEVPAAGARGRERTLWLLDRDAAAQLDAESRTT